MKTFKLTAYAIGILGFFSGAYVLAQPATKVKPAPEMYVVLPGNAISIVDKEKFYPKTSCYAARGKVMEYFGPKASVSCLVGGYKGIDDGSGYAYAYTVNAYAGQISISHGCKDSKVCYYSTQLITRK